MGNSQLNNVVNGFIKIVEELKNEKVIEDKDLKDYTKSNLHSWLQYALIKSAEQKELFAIPEIKLRFTEPIDHRKYGVKTRTRKRHFSKVDIAFYDNSKDLLGVSEIFTMDQAHASLPSRKLAGVGHYWLTPRDSLIHMVQYATPKPKFIILVTILLKKSSYISWKTRIKRIDSELEKCKNYYKVFKPYWKEFKEKIEIENSLLIISEDGIERI